MTIDNTINEDIRKLNSAQQSAALHKNGPAVVYAGAGSGKTRVICARIAWLILNENVAPSSILAVTFTNKAAKEMKERIEKYIGFQRSKYIIVSTFHAFCARFLRIYAEEAGFNSAFSIYDDNDQKSLLKDILKQLNVPDKLLSVQTVKSKIDKIKNKGLSPEEYLNEINSGGEEKEKKRSFQGFGEQQYDPHLIQKVYAYYQKKLKQQNSLDFNDLLLVMYQLLVNKPHVLQSMQNRFQYFLIDEFQDTNPIQFKLIHLLSSHTKNLFIVGDDDQSIYSWRGAEPSFILNFDKIFVDAKTYKLEENYRSTNTIIEAATGIIKNNRTRAPKTLFTTKTNGNKIKVKGCEDPYIESNYIANEIFSAVQNNTSFSDFCILYRTNAQSRSLEDELRRRMMPYVIYGSVRFYERAEVKILLGYLKLLVNTADNASFEKVVNTPRRGFGDTAMQKLKEVANERGESLAKTASELAYGSLQNNVARSISGLKSFIHQVQKWKQLLIDGHKASVTLSIITSDISFEEYIRNTYPEDFDERWLNIIELKNAVAEFEAKELNADEENTQTLTPLETISKFIEQAMLTVEPTVVNAKQGNANAVTMMTIHSAKGLEFPNVFIAGLEEGVLPHQNSLNDFDSVEEERRLMYVAVTRAQNNLTLTYCRRNRYKDFLPAQESRFIAEVPMDCREFVDHFNRNQIKLTQKTVFEDTPRKFRDIDISENFSDDNYQWHKGQRVAHKTFGEGIINGVEKSSQGFKLKVKFDTNGEKTLIHSFVTPI
ncbi:MAG: UvrD-helicase domain-containing protein [Bdellovibrionota bacterium]